MNLWQRFLKRIHWVEPKFDSLGDELVWRASTAIGGFDMGLCIRIINQLRNRLNKPLIFYWPPGPTIMTRKDVSKIIQRYHTHVGFWNVRLEVIQSELRQFAEAVNLKPNDVFREFDQLTEDMKL